MRTVTHWLVLAVLFRSLPPETTVTVTVRNSSIICIINYSVVTVARSSRGGAQGRRRQGGGEFGTF